MDDREKDLDRVRNSIGMKVVKRRSGALYQIELFDEVSERVILVPLHKGGRTTKKWFRHLFIDYRAADEAPGP